MDAALARKRAQQALAHIDRARGALEAVSKSFNGEEAERYLQLVKAAQGDLEQAKDFTDRCRHNF